jgi:hypothetical protein
MTSQTNLIRAAALFAACLLIPSLAQAQTQHPVSGSNLRFQIGNGLPIPIATQGSAPPIGRVNARGNARITQQTNGNVTIQPSQFTAPGNAVNQPVFNANTSVFQVLTAIPLTWPTATVNFVADGRTGADVVSFCAGDVVTANGNPNCASPGAGGNVINGLMRYTRTSGMLGGAGRARTGGIADVAIRFNQGAPCAAGVNGSLDPLCQAFFALATPAGTGAQGAAFGVVVGTAGGTPPTGRFYVTVAGAATSVASSGPQAGLGGRILGIDTVNPQGPGLPNPATSYGGPWTVGKLTVSVTQNIGATSEVFVLTGSDNRTANGAGTLSLVSGAVSNRTLTAPNANRGWLNLTIGQAIGTTPALSGPAVGAVMGMLALAGAYVVRRRRA